MILDTIKKFHTQFGDLSEKDCGLLGITPRIEPWSALKAQLLAGKWSALHISIANGLRVSTALKIIPDKPGTAWPVYWLFPRGQFQATQITAYLPYIHTQQLFSLCKIGKLYRDTWQDKIAVMGKIQEAFGGKISDFDEMREIVFDENKWAKPGKEFADLPERGVPGQKYKEYWLKHDANKGTEYLFNLLDKVIADKNYLPEAVPDDLGIYEPRIKTIVAMRALNLFDSKDKMLPGLLVPHGFDMEDNDPTYAPSTGHEGDLRYLADRVALRYNEDNSQEMESLPEARALKIIAGQIDGDEGLAFLEAAAKRDEKFNQPLQAWNNLVSAGFWTGINMGNTAKCAQAQAVLIEAAIALCQKQNWLEAREVLKHNLDILQSV